MWEYSYLYVLDAKHIHSYEAKTEQVEGGRQGKSAGSSHCRLCRVGLPDEMMLSRVHTRVGSNSL